MCIVIVSLSCVDKDIQGIPRADAGVLLFSLQVSPADAESSNLVDTLPARFPPKPRYLLDLIPRSAADISDCECPGFNPAQFRNDPCIVQMRANNGHTINVRHNFTVLLQSIILLYCFNL